MKPTTFLFPCVCCAASSATASGTETKKPADKKVKDEGRASQSGTVSMQREIDRKRRQEQATSDQLKKNSKTSNGTPSHLK